MIWPLHLLLRRDKGRERERTQKRDIDIETWRFIAGMY